MQMHVQDLLEFCAYYQLNKYASKLTVETIFQDNYKPSPIKQKPEKVARKKLEVVEPKKPQKVEKVVKPKMEIVPKKEKVQVPSKAIAKKRQQNDGLDYFLSHMTGASYSNNQIYYQEMMYSKRPEGMKAQYNSKNYDTFGRSNQNYQYETFQSKMQRQNAQYSRTNMTERPPQYKAYLPKANLTQNKLPISPYQNYQGQKIKKFWENTVYETRKNNRMDFGNLMYSPVKRQNISPSQSIIFSQFQQRSLSKSKSKLKRKNSQRPFYNASQLTPRDRENDTRTKKIENDQSMLSNSFISTEQMRVSNNKKALDDEGRRETSTTSYAAKNPKLIGRKETFENDLDDGMEEVINHLASEQRNAPIAISLVSREGKL